MKIQDLKDMEYLALERLRKNPSEENRLAHVAAYKALVEATRGKGVWVSEPNFPFNCGNYVTDTAEPQG